MRGEKKKRAENFYDGVVYLFELQIKYYEDLDRFTMQCHIISLI
jgi:hypothetical protein